MQPWLLTVDAREIGRRQIHLARWHGEALHAVLLVGDLELDRPPLRRTILDTYGRRTRRLPERYADHRHPAIIGPHHEHAAAVEGHVRSTLRRCLDTEQCHTARDPALLREDRRRKLRLGSARERRVRNERPGQCARPPHFLPVTRARRVPRARLASIS